LGVNRADGKGGKEVRELKSLGVEGFGSIEKQFFFSWKLSESFEILICALFKLLVRLVSSIPRSVQMMVKMHHFYAKSFPVIVGLVGESLDGLIQLLGSFTEMEQHDIAIHNSENYGLSIL